MQPIKVSIKLVDGKSTLVVQQSDGSTATGILTAEETAALAGEMLRVALGAAVQEAIHK